MSETGGRRVLRLVSRIGVAALSLMIVAVSALVWVQLRGLDRSTSMASLIGAPAPPPAAEQNILLVGVDSRTDAAGNPLPAELLASLHAGSTWDGGNTADTIMVVHVPAGGGRATAVSIPRDSFVQLADGFGKHKINSAWSRAAQDTVDAMTRSSSGGGGASSPMFAPEVLPGVTPAPNDPTVARAAAAAGAPTPLEPRGQLTGLPISHVASVNLAGFADVSQAIGGVPVCLRAPVADPYSGLVLPAGVQQIAGAQALAFVRQRHGLPNGDLDRITRQQVFLGSATDKLLSAGTLTDPFALARIGRVVTRNVTLDSGWNVLSFAQQMQGLTAGAVTFRTIPTGDTAISTPDDGTAVEVDPAQVRAFVADSLATDAGAPRPAPSSAPVPVPAGIPSPAGPGRAAPPPAAPTPVAASPTPPITAATPGCIN